MAAVVKCIEKGSLAHLAGISKGDILLSVNDECEFDILYYRFLSEAEKVALKVRKKNGGVEEIEILNNDFENLGITFEKELIDNPMPCQNKCIFCFVDQLPKGMRKTLYFKDDDYRLSMLTGSYITLTNLSEKDISKIIKMRLPRINISVHAVDIKMRRLMINNENADVFTVMKRFADAKILMNCQIVLCKGINDGQALCDTVYKLFSLYPYVQSLSVVPVGLTAHRHGLTKLQLYDKKTAMSVVTKLQAYQKEFLTQQNTRFVFPSDELYIYAGLPIPAFEEYEDFLQLENGVGLIALFNREFINAFNGSTCRAVKRHISIATGESAAPFIKRLVGMLSDSEKVSIFTIKNKFFGENITVTGLITGQDLVGQLKGKSFGKALLIPQSMLNADKLFLDDMTLFQVQRQIGVEVKALENDGCKFFNALVGR